MKRFKGPIESRTRTVLKAISWRVIATLTSMTIVYVMTKRPLSNLSLSFLSTGRSALWIWRKSRNTSKI